MDTEQDPTESRVGAARFKLVNPNPKRQAGFSANPTSQSLTGAVDLHTI